MRASPAPRHWRLLLFCLIATSSSLSASAQYQISPSITALPAGAPGVTFTATANDSSPTADFNLCFYTGYGSTAPIAPSTYVNSGASSQFTVIVPAPIIQDVPPSAFTSGSFTAFLYSVPLSTTTCTGSAQSQQTAASITLNYPTLTSLSLYQLTQQNPNLTSRLPSNLSAVGTNFIAPSNTTGTVFNFTSGSTVAGTVTFISSTAIIATIPINLPTADGPITVQACNTAVYSYCSAPNSLRISLSAQQPLINSMAASPNPASPTQAVVETATFGAASPSTGGAPSGLVRFYDGDKGWGSFPLVLDHTASFVMRPVAPFTVNTTPIPPLIADFNKDGVPDILFIEPGNATNPAVLHLLVGEGAGPGSFSRNLTFNVQPGSGFHIFSAATGDFNNDGFPDIVLLCQNSANPSNPIALYTLLGNGDGTFQPGFQSSPSLNGAQIVAGDFNKDGKLDIVIAGLIDIDPAVGFLTLLGDGSGNFTPGPVTTGLSTAPDASFGDFKLASADFNNDGYPDIAVLNGADVSGTLDASVELYQNDGTGAFSAPVKVPTDGTNTANFFIAELRANELPDVIVTSIASSNRGITVAFNQSTTTIAFSSTPEFTPIPGLTQAVFGDFNGDGNVDAVIDNGNAIDVYTGCGSGCFSFHFTSLTVAPPAGTTLLAASDQNGDGYADLLLYISAASTITPYDFITAGTATATAEAIPFAVGTHTLHATTPGTFYIGPGSQATTPLVIIAPTPVVTLTASVLSPSNYGTPVQLTAQIADITATGTISFYNGTALLGTTNLAVGTAAVATITPPTLPAATYSFTAVYSGDSNHTAATSAAFPLKINPIPATLTWTPTPSTITYGAALSASQLDATTSGIISASVAGSFSYSPGIGAILSVGTSPVLATFTPTDPNYLGSTITRNITVTRATPTIIWTPNPSTINYGIALNTAQLDATSSTQGTFTYTPTLGTVLPAGPQALSVLFTPNDTADYTTASASVSINVSTLSLTSLSQSLALLGDPATKITLTGTSFISTAAVLVNGTPIPTTYVSPTTLSATIPAAGFLTVNTLQVSVGVSSLNETSVSLPLYVVAPIASVIFSGPNSIVPGTQTTLNFKLTNPYPVDLTATLTLGFNPANGLPADKTLLFANGTTVFPVVIPANSTATPAVEIQTGTIAGSITVSLGLEAGGANVTPSTVQPLLIEAPFDVPGITSVAVTATGDTLTVVTRGFSNTRELRSASFHFTPTHGHSIATKDVILDIGPEFAAWYASQTSQLYGSEFTYTQVFNLNSDASVVGQVTVVLTNTQGASLEANTP